MRLVVDSNVILSGLLKDGLSREIIFSKNLRFISLGYVLEECEKYMDYLVEKSGKSKEELSVLLSLFVENIEIVEDSFIINKMDSALEVMKDIDEKDAPILACALAVSNNGIWSDDKHLTRQDRVKVWKTSDLIEFI